MTHNKLTGVFKRIGSTKTGFLLLGLISAVTITRAQQHVPSSFQAVSIQNRTLFNRIPANWSFGDSIAIHPDKANLVKVIAGQRILIGKPGEGISLPVQSPNIRLYLRYTLSPGANATIQLPGGAKVLLTEGATGTHISGYTGQFPSQDAGKKAGLTQTIELDYESDIQGIPGKSRLNELKINGVVVQRGQYFNLLPSTNSSVQVEKGTIAISAIGVQTPDHRKPVKLSNLSYKIYNDAWNSRKTDLLGESGNSPHLTVEVADGKRTYNLVYEGDLIVDEEGDYSFNAIYAGAYCQLSIDGNVILDEEQSELPEPHTTRVKLDSGKYRFKIWYSKLPWKPASLGLRIGKGSIREYDLHALASLPEPPAKPFISAIPGNSRPEMIRSFLQIPGESHKRTHCLSVGSKEGRHYSVDLNRGALLQVWNGEFANTTEMWFERGEPQLLSPQGMTVPISGRSSFVRLTTPESPWLDSAAINFQGYRIDTDGFPAVRYVLGASVIEDAIRATPAGVTRTITPERNALPSNYVLIAEGDRITMLEKGLYTVDGRFYIKLGGNYSPILRRSGVKSELLLPLATPVTYAIQW